MLNDVQRAYNRGWNDAIDRVNAVLREFAELTGKWDDGEDGAGGRETGFQPLDEGEDVDGAGGRETGCEASLARENDCDRKMTGK